MGFLIFCWCIAGICFSLGFWQVLRGQEKQELLSRIEANLSAEPMELSDDLLGSKGVWKLVEVEGYFSDKGGEVFLLLNRVRDGEVGYGLLRILHSEGGAILVDMGWVPLDYEIGGGGKIVVRGIVREVLGRGAFVPENDIEKSLWYYIDIGEMELVSGLDLVDFYIMVDRDFWKLIPNNHLGYSLTWGGLGLIFLVLSAVIFIRQRNPNS